MMAAVATMVMSLGELLGPAAGDLAGLEVRDLVADSRQIEPGAAFVALPGSRGHGLDFAEDARARGAAVVIYEPSAAHAEVAAPSVAVPDLTKRVGELARMFFWQSRDPVVLTGVTGTNGKSTVAYLMAEARTRLNHPCGYLGTLGAGVPPALKPQALTTPDCLTLHRSLRALDVGEATMEVSSHALTQDRIAGLSFTTAVFTNLSRDHLDYHGDLESYQAAKARLFSLDGLEHAVIFIDDPFGAVLAGRLPASVVPTTVSFAGNAHVEGRLIESGLSGIRVEVRTPQGTATIDSPLLGDINAENLLLALGGLLTLDTPLGDASAALEQCAGLPGRMELVDRSDAGAAIVIDYAHTPDALRRVLGTLRRCTDAQLWCVFGCGGERDVGKRPAMGGAASAAEHIILTDDNPRGEDPATIVADIHRGIEPDVDVVVEHDRRAAIELALERAASGDIVLIAGKGHETTQTVAGRSLPFSDRAVVVETLGASA
jgi:UDP-N-acetylmuramoyl-L-alanyl-D-glutamate--2,6-diaminopimelate ligase